MRIYGTPPSHFTRKVRVVLQELGLAYQFEPFEISRLSEMGAEKFAGNPLHLLPVLEDGTETLFDSSVICEYLIERYGKGKELNSFYQAKLRDQRVMAITNGAMSAGVTLVRAKRSGLENWDDYTYFRQEKAAIAAAQVWLDKELGERPSFYPGILTVPDITLMCMLEWASFRNFSVPESETPNLTRFVKHWENRPSFAKTHPRLEGVTQ